MLEKTRAAFRSVSDSVSRGLGEVSNRASRTSRQASVVSKHLVRKARDMSASDVQSAAKSFAGGVVLGDFYNDQTPAAHAGRIVGGVIPFVGNAASARDCVAAVHRLSKGERRAAFDLTLGVLSFIPGARLAANAVRGAQTAMTHASQLGGLVEKLEIEAQGLGAPALVDASGLATARATVEKFFANYALIGDPTKFAAAQAELLADDLRTVTTDPRGTTTYTGRDAYFASVADWTAAYATGPDFKVELTQVAANRVEARLHGTLTAKDPRTERSVVLDSGHMWTQTFAIDDQRKITAIDQRLSLAGQSDSTDRA